VLLVVRVMDDIVSLGQGRGTRRWPRRLVVIAVAAVIVATVVQHLPRSPAPVHRRPDVLAVGQPYMRAVGPVQLAGLGFGAAQLLYDAAQDHRALLAERARKADRARRVRRRAGEPTRRRHRLTPW
jgi:hypothetical protein